MPCSPWNDLELRRTDLMRQIASAAGAGDSATLLARSRELAAVDDLLARFRDVDQEAKRFLGGAPHTPTSIPGGSAHESQGSRSREIGIQTRSNFALKAKSLGVELQLLRGSIYRLPSGVRVGTAVATERHRGRWFLGLSEGAFDCAVLLCVESSGRVLDICLPSSFFHLHGAYLSKSGGQVKFNVAKRGAEVVLKIPSHAPENVTSFVGSITALA